MKKTANTLNQKYKYIKSDFNDNESNKSEAIDACNSINTGKQEKQSNRTYKMHPLNYWSGPHFLFHIAIPNEK